MSGNILHNQIDIQAILYIYRKGRKKSQSYIDREKHI